MIAVILYRIRQIIILTVILIPVLSFSLNEIPVNHANLKQSTGFIENKGQIIDQNNKPNPAVLYLLNTPGMNVQLRKSGFSYDVYSIDNPASVYPPTNSAKPPLAFMRGAGGEVVFHRIDIDLQHSNPNPVIETSIPSTDYLNYYTTGTPDEGVTLVKSFGGITYKDVYPGIDLQFIAGDGGVFEYNFLIRPGADISSIQLKLSGPEKVKKFRDGIRMNTSLGDVDETIPLCYYSMNNTQVPVKGRFKRIADQIYGFTVDQAVPSGAVLLIDPIPTRRWGTYYGGTQDDFILRTSLGVDDNGDIILGGCTNSFNNIASAGAYQATIGSPTDGFIAKFNGDGQRIWGTYYGGGGGDVAWGLSVDQSGNIILVGLSSSESGMASPGAFQTTMRGLADAFVAKFNPSGFRIWGTYYGGNEVPPNGEVIKTCGTDSNGNIYCFGETSAPDFITTPGAHQTNISGSRDNYIVKFTGDGNRVWGTYYGGTNLEEYVGGCVSNSGLIFISGKTSSPNNIATPGSFLPNLGTPPKAFLACFDYDGVRQWGTYFGGESMDDSYGCTIDPPGNVYLFGQTLSFTNIATPGTFQSNKLSGFWDAYLEKFTFSGVRLWGTYFGKMDAQIQGAAVDGNGFVYLAGYANAQDTLLFTPDAYQTVHRGLMDAILAKFTGSGQRIWSTYYGGINSDFGWGVATDLNENIFLAGHTATANISDNSGLCTRSALKNIISTSGAHQQEFGGWGDAFLVKFTDCDSPDTARSLAGPLQLCQNSTGVVFSIPPITAATDYHWCVSGNLTIVSGQGTTAITVDVGPSTGFDTISVYGINACDNGFPKIIVRQVFERPSPVISGPDTTCTGMANLFTSVGGKSIYVWSFSPGYTLVSGGTISDSSCTVYWSTGGANWVKLNYTDTTGCDALDPMQFDIWVNAGSQVSVNITPSVNPVCTGNPVIISATGLNGGSSPAYQWKVNGIDAGANNPVFSYSPVNGDVVTCILSSDLTCASNNPDTSSAIIMVVNPVLPVSVNVTSSMNPVCAGTQVTYTAVPVNGGTTPQYQWKVNGLITGTNSPNFSYVPANGDLVSCTLLSSETCTSNNPASSIQFPVSVLPLLPVSVSIIASSNPFCSGNPVTFTATPVNGGTNPFYQWKVNGNNAGTNNPVFSYSPANGDLVSCWLTSSEMCESGNPGMSDNIAMVVNTSLPAGITIAASANPFCPGAVVIFTAISANGGSNPTYQWKVNGINAGTNSSGFSYVPANNDSVRCVITSNLSCVTGNPASSPKIIMLGTLAPTVTFTPCFDTITTLNAKPFRLKGGLPLGGTYSGPGVDAATGTLTPSAAGPGLKTLTYSYTNTYQCTVIAHSSLLILNSPSFTCGGNFTDPRDGKSYQTTQIGTQCWMAENLEYGMTIDELTPQTDNCVAEHYIRQSSFVLRHSLTPHPPGPLLLKAKGEEALHWRLPNSLGGGWGSGSVLNSKFDCSNARLFNLLNFKSEI
jgi:hypothetical protein